MTQSDLPDSFLTVAEVADLLKLNQQTVRNWIDQGELAAVRLGRRRVRIRRSELERLIAAGESSSPAADEVQGPPAGAEEQSTDDAWERFRAAMGASSAAMDDDPHELAEALNTLADAARSLAGALAERSPR